MKETAAVEGDEGEEEGLDISELLEPKEGREEGEEGG